MNTALHSTLLSWTQHALVMNTALHSTLLSWTQLYTARSCHEHRSTQHALVMNTALHSMLLSWTQLYTARSCHEHSSTQHALVINTALHSTLLSWTQLYTARSCHGHSSIHLKNIQTMVSIAHEQAPHKIHFPDTTTPNTPFTQGHAHCINRKANSNCLEAPLSTCFSVYFDSGAFQTMVCILVAVALRETATTLMNTEYTKQT